MAHSAGFGAGECDEFGVGLSVAEELRGQELDQGVLDTPDWESSLKGSSISRVHEGDRKSPLPSPDPSPTFTME